MHQMFEQFHNELYRAVAESLLGRPQIIHEHANCADILQFLDIVMYQRNPVLYILEDFSFDKIASMQAYLTRGYTRPTPVDLQPISKALAKFYGICNQLGFHYLSTDIPAQLHEALASPEIHKVFASIEEKLYIPHREVLTSAHNLVTDFRASFVLEDAEEYRNTEYLNDR